MKRLIDRDYLTGIETWHEYDSLTQETRIHYQPFVDMDDTLTICRSLADDDARTKKGIKEDWWHYSFIPDWLQLKWYVEEGVPIGDAEAYNMRVNRPEYRYLKTTAKFHGSKDKQIFLPK